MTDRTWQGASTGTGVLNTPTAPLPTPSFADTITAARDADHLARCTNCREQAAVTDAAIAENGASMARRDRVTLGLRNARRLVTV